MKIKKLHQEIILNFLSMFYMSTTSSHSNESSNSFLELKSVWIDSIKLKGDLHSILESFGQFLFTKIFFLKLSNCKQHFLKFVSMLV